MATFFVYGLFGSDYDGSPYTQSGDLVAELAARGIRLVIEEFRADVTKTLKDGSRGKLRIDYGDPKQPEKPIAWLWKFIDGAKTAGELYGRALVVIAAEQHACRLVVPSSQRFGAKRWPSHKDHAAKALQKLAGPHLPATLKQLEKAIAKAGAELHDGSGAGSQPRAAAEPSLFVSQAPRPMPAPSTTLAEPGETADGREDVGDEQLEDEDLVDAVRSPIRGDGHSDTQPPAESVVSGERYAGLTTGPSRSSAPALSFARRRPALGGGSPELCSAASSKTRRRTSRATGPSASGRRPEPASSAVAHEVVPVKASSSDRDA